MAIRRLEPGEAHILEIGILRYLIHRPGDQNLYLVYEEDSRQESVEALGTFSDCSAAFGAIQARQTGLAPAV